VDTSQLYLNASFRKDFGDTGNIFDLFAVVWSTASSVVFLIVFVILHRDPALQAPFTMRFRVETPA
jgi:hypothetical protein